VDKAIEKLIKKRNLLLAEMQALESDNGMLGIKDLMIHTGKAQRIHCINYAIHLLGDR